LPNGIRKNGHDPFAERLRFPAGLLESVIYESAAERFFRPTTLIEVLELVRDIPTAATDRRSD